METAPKARIFPIVVDGKKCLAATGAARYKGVAQMAIVKAIDRGDLPEIRIEGDRRRFVPIAALDRWTPNPNRQWAKRKV